MKIKRAKRGVVGLSAVLAAAVLAVVPAVSASAALVPTVGSAHPVYLMDAEFGVPHSAGTALGWNDDVISSPDGTIDSSFPVPAGAATVRSFIAPRGQEKNQTAWNASKPLGLTPGGILLPNLMASSNTSAGQGSPSGTGAIANAGGDYSIGIAFISNNGNTVIEADYTYITVTANANPNLATWTFDVPAAPATAPAITTQPANASVLPGQTATFTAAASGTTPTVQWQSSTDGTTFADIVGATSASYTTAATTLADAGKQFRAVFTNSAGAATTSAATLTVTNTTPTQPTGSDAGKVTIANPAEGATTVTVAAGSAHANQTLQAWGWSAPTSLGQVTTDANGNATVDISTLPVGTHTVALTLPNSAAVIAWGTFDVPALTYPPLTDTVDLTATVKASDLWSLNADYASINFNDVSRGQSSTRALGKVTVIDDRNVLKGWTLTAAWPQFTTTGGTIPASAMTLTPKTYNNSALHTGISLGAAAGLVAESALNVSTGTAGALFDGDLTFTAPADAAVGTYSSTLTLTLTSK